MTTSREYFNDQFFGWKRLVEVASAVLSLEDDALPLETVEGYRLSRHFTKPEAVARYDTMYARKGEKTSPVTRHLGDLASLGMVEVIHPGPNPPAEYEVTLHPIWQIVQAYNTAVAEMFPEETK